MAERTSTAGVATTHMSGAAAARDDGRGDREFLVALPQLRFVQGILARDDHEERAYGPIRVEGTAQVSEDLGLALIRLENLEEAAAMIKARVEGDARATAWLLDAGRRLEDTGGMDRFLLGLRAVIAGQSAGWTPTLGKNRLMGSVIGGGTIRHGGGGAPRMTKADLPVRGTGPGRDVRVGVLDTAFSPQPWLSGGWAARYSDRLQGPGPYSPAAGHATFVAGLVLAQAPGATVETRSVLDEEGKADSWTVANEIVALGRSGVDVLNLSLVCYTEDGEAPLAMATAIDRLDPDIVVVAAAGNHGAEDPGSDVGRSVGRRPAFPAALDDVVAVGAANRRGERSPFTPPDVPWIDLLTFGENVVSTFIDGPVEIRFRDDGDNGPRGQERLREEKFTGFASWSGTSFAAALVSGAIAAGTQPGRVTARQSWENIRGALSRNPHAAKQLLAGGPPLLPLDAVFGE